MLDQCAAFKLDLRELRKNRGFFGAFAQLVLLQLTYQNCISSNEWRRLLQEIRHLMDVSARSLKLKRDVKYSS